MTPNAIRMQAAVDFVTQNPGTTMPAVIARVLDVVHGDDEKRFKPSSYKQAAGVVERVIKSRLVRLDPSRRLYLWDSKRKTYAEALQRAAFAAPDKRRYLSTMALAAQAWREAGDENHARILERIAVETTEPPPADRVAQLVDVEPPPTEAYPS